jgi:hypothetical protein
LPFGTECGSSFSGPKRAFTKSGRASLKTRKGRASFKTREGLVCDKKSLKKLSIGQVPHGFLKRHDPYGFLKRHDPYGFLKRHDPYGFLIYPTLGSLAQSAVVHLRVLKLPLS